MNDNSRDFNKDLHVSFRINKEMLNFHEELMDEIGDRVGRKIPHSKILRAMIAVNRDPQFRKIFIKRISGYLKEGLDRW
ncbi:MAG: hypothetical protein GF392_06055 [Candidatus Omnitrophica bacterium]|nr:hypothetical protein [Candidatus Omnitrophota bacterium]